MRSRTCYNNKEHLCSLHGFLHFQSGLHEALQMIWCCSYGCSFSVVLAASKTRNTGALKVDSKDKFYASCKTDQQPLKPCSRQDQPPDRRMCFTSGCIPDKHLDICFSSSSHSLFCVEPPRFKRSFLCLQAFKHTQRGSVLISMAQ